MKAISIKNPFATQIMRGTKNIEYRTWDTKHRGDLLICSSANPQVPGMMSGCALCVVELVDTQYDSANDVYEWHLSNVRKIKAFPVKGKLNFFEVDDALIHFADEEHRNSQTSVPKAANTPAAAPVFPQMPGMPKTIDNVTLRVKDDLEETITRKSKLRIAAACFSIYAYEELKKTFRSDVDAIMEETKRVEGLWGELQTLADENGNVEEANRNRANYILGELSTATGEEWQMIDGTIQRYDDLTNSIEATIKAKKAEKLVEAGEESYNTAKTNYDESLDALEFMDNQVRAQRAQLESYNQALAEFESEHAQELRGVDYNLADLYAIDPSLALTWEDLTDKVTDTENVLIGLEAEYEEANKTTAKYYEDIYYFEQAQEALLSGNYDEAIELMTRDTAYRWNNLAEKRKITKEELSDLKKDYESALFVAENYRKNYEAGMVGYTADGLHEAVSAAAELGRIWAEAARDAEVSGRNIAKGLARGMKDSVTDVDNAAGYVANTALSKIKNVAQIASPSKVTTSYGKYIDDGLIVGLKLKMQDVSRAASQIADAVLASVDPGLDLSVNAASPSAWYVPAQQQSSAVYNNSTSLGGITVYVDAKNVDNVEDLAELVADKINTDIINRQAVSK